MPCRPRRSPASSGRGARSAVRRRNGTGSAPPRPDRSDAGPGCRSGGGAPRRAAGPAGRRSGRRRPEARGRTAPGPAPRGRGTGRGCARGRSRARARAAPKPTRSASIAPARSGASQPAIAPRTASSVSSSAAATPARSSSAENGTPPSRRLAYERRLLAVRALGKLAGAAGERAQPLSRRLGLAQAREVAGRVLPVGDGLAHRGRVPAPDSRLDRVDGAGVERGIEAQVREQRADRSLVGGRLGRARSAPRPPASARAPATTRARPGSPSPAEPKRAGARPGRDGGARSTISSGAWPERKQAGDLDPDRLRLAARPCRLQQHQAIVGRRPAADRARTACGRGGAAWRCWCSRRRRGARPRSRAPSSLNCPISCARGRQRPAIGEGDRDGDRRRLRRARRPARAGRG